MAEPSNMKEPLLNILAQGECWLPNTKMPRKQSRRQIKKYGIAIKRAEMRVRRNKGSVERTD